MASSFSSRIFVCTTFHHTVSRLAFPASVQLTGTPVNGLISNVDFFTSPVLFPAYFSS